MEQVNSIQFSQTSQEWRKVFIFAITAIHDMHNRPDITLDEIFESLSCMIRLNKLGAFFPDE